MSRGELVGPVVPRVVRGRPDEVANALRTMRRNQVLIPRSGRVIGYEGGPDPILAVEVRVIDRTPARKRDRTTRRVVIVFAGGMPAAGLGGLVFRWLTGDLLLVALGTLFLFVAVVTGLLAAFSGGGVSGIFGVGGGHHCPGCPDH